MRILSTILDPTLDVWVTVIYDKGNSHCQICYFCVVGYLRKNLNVCSVCTLQYCDDFPSSYRGTSKLMALVTLGFIVVIFAVLYFLVIATDSKYKIKNR